MKAPRLVPMLMAMYLPAVSTIAWPGQWRILRRSTPAYRKWTAVEC